MKPAELDELACRAVGIEAVEVWVEARPRPGCGSGPREFRKEDWQLWKQTGEFYPDVEEFEVFPPVSQTAEGCAMLKAAVLEKHGSWPVAAPSEDGGFIAIVGETDIEWAEPDAPFITAATVWQGGQWVGWARGETEERAVALAVVAWGEACRG